MIFAWAICMLSTTITGVESNHTNCPDNHWGPPDCLEHCHCDAGIAACRESDGFCLHGICSQGYMGMPACRTPCRDGHFGRNCMYHCHCPDGDTCSKVNGLCSGGMCGRGWTGPSCQTRLPELKIPPQLIDATNNSLVVKWQRWDPTVDIGIGPVVYYVLEYQKEGDVTWRVDTTLLASNSTINYTHDVIGLEKDTAYRFRVILGYEWYEKWVQSVASEASPYYRTTGAPPTVATTQVTTDATTDTVTNMTALMQNTTTTALNSTQTPSSTTITTKKPTTAKPGPTLPPNPVAIRLVFRNHTTLRVKWELTTTLYKWCWKKYVVTLQSTSSGSSRKKRSTQQILETSETEATFSGLETERAYNITVESVPEKDVLPFKATTQLWTLPSYIQPPRRPKFINATATTITVMLYGVDEVRADVRSYQVVVEDESENEQDDIASLSIAVSAGLTIDAATFYAYDQRRRNKNHPNAYVTGRLDDDDVDPDGTVFTIGNEKHHGSYDNIPLEKTSEYAIWCVATYNYRGDPVSQLRRSKDTYIPGSLVVSAPPPAKSTLHGGYIAAIVISIILLLIAIAIIWFILTKQDRERMKYFTKFPLFRRTAVPDENERSTQIAAPPHSPTKYKPRRSLYEELDFESSGPPIHVPKPQGVVTDASYVALRNSNAIKVEKMKQYCLEREATDFSIAEEYRHLPIGLIDSVHAATKPNNALLNRTSHILPYDTNRIKVKSIEPSGEGHDYINASLVKTHLHTFYVVTQCPMNTTMGEFWRMVWEQEVSVIVALLAMDEPDKPEYKTYWPKIDDHPLLYHDVRVSCNGTERSAHYAIRTFYVSRLVGEREQIRCVRHYQFVSWTKTGIPKYTAPFLDFMDRVREGHKKNPKSVLVHCHSGGGRSGMFVAIDTLINEGQQKGQVDVLKCVTKLRQERPNMVKHLRQYKFIYEALIDYFLCAESAADAKGFRKKYQAMNQVNKNMNNSRPQLALEFEAIENLQNLLQSPNKSSRGTLKDEPFVSPMKKSASFLIGDEILYPNEDEHSLLTAHLDSFSERDRFIIAKHPKTEQLVDFWDILAGNRCAACVSLNSSDAASTQYIPKSQRKPHCETYANHIVTVSESPAVSDAFVVTDTVVHPSDDPQKSFSMKNFEFTNWCGHNDAPSVKHMLSLIQTVRDWSFQQTGPIVVHSNRGCDRPMIFCLLWSVFERIDLECKVNLFRAVLHHRTFVPTTVYNASQYRFIHQCVNEYISQRPSLMDATAVSDISIEGPQLRHELLLHSQSMLHDWPAAALVDEDPSPTPSQLSACINQAAMDKTLEDLGTWFSKANETVLERSKSEGNMLDMPDLDDEDLQKKRQEKFDKNLLELFQVK